MNRKRMQSRSNQQFQNIIHSPDNPINQASPPTSIQSPSYPQNHDRQLYKQSFFKIQKIKASLLSTSSQQLMQQLNDIIDLIKGQRVKAKFTIEQLRNLSEMYEKMDGGTEKKEHSQFGINTDDIVIGQFDDNIDIGIQVEFQDEKKNEEVESQQQKMRKSKQKQKKQEAYYKLVCMIDKLKVDYRQILPTLQKLPGKFILPDVESNKKAYRVLTNQQILKLQKVFIEKLNGMVQQKQKSSKDEKSRKNSQNSKNFQTPKRKQNKNELHQESTSSKEKEKGNGRNKEIDTKGKQKIIETKAQRINGGPGEESKNLEGTGNQTQYLLN